MANNSNPKLTANYTANCNFCLSVFIEHEKTEKDRDREEELLTQILELVTKRSNIVDKMDEERLRFVLRMRRNMTSFNVASETSKTNILRLTKQLSKNVDSFGYRS